VTRPRLYGGYVLDLDGTVYLDDELLPGADTAIAGLRERGAAVVFATNKPLETAAQYAAKLTRLGIPTTADEVVTAPDSLIDHLRAEHPGARLLTIAEDVLVQRLAGEGFTVTGDPRSADVVVVSFDRTFDYAKLVAAYRAVLEGGAAIVATNPDPYCPTADGGLPDCAAMLAALEACTGHTAEAVLGKPSLRMGRTCLARLGVPAADVAVVGDRILTDVAMGKRLGAAGILVLSGATLEADVAGSGVTPDAVLSGIAELVPVGDEDDGSASPT
jgi:HAD superfamily hydrolase (TIGR01450 family)